MKNIIIILTVFAFGCRTTSKTPAVNLTAENNKDVFILSNLIQDHLRRSNERVPNLNELVQRDSLKRISHNFETITLESRGGCIAVYFVFAASRNNKIDLTPAEGKRLAGMKIVSRKLDKQYDGEIQFEYGERFYNRKKVIVNR